MCAQWETIAEFPGGGLDAPNAFKAEKDQLELMQHTCRINQFVEAATKSIKLA